MQALQRPQEDALRFGAHLFSDIGIVLSVRVFLLGGEDDLSAEKTNAAVIERLQDTVTQADEAYIQITLIALLSLFLQIHRQLRCDNRLDVVGLGESFQFHIIVQHHKLMFQICTSKGTCLHLCDTACVHVAAKQRTKDDTDAAFPLAALTDQQEHLLSLGGGDKAISHNLLQGQNVLRL